MTTYRINQEKQGIELVFDSIPSATIRDTLKQQGWRWSRFGGFWYNRNTPENEQTARDLADGKAPTPAQPKSAPVAKKSPFTDEHPADKYAADVIGYIKLSTGEYIPFEKSKIKTRLCFGFDELRSETIEQSNHSAHAAQNEYTFFENLQTQEIDRDIEIVTRALNVQNEIAENRATGRFGCYSARDFVYVYPNTWRGEKLAGWQAYNPDNKPIEQAINAADLRAILDGLNAQKEYKQKQARTYWKRFGGSKLHTWTYSVND